MPRPYLIRARSHATAYAPKKAAPAYIGHGARVSIRQTRRIPAMAPSVCRNMAGAYHG